MSDKQVSFNIAGMEIVITAENYTGEVNIGLLKSIKLDFNNPQLNQRISIEKSYTWRILDDNKKTVHGLFYNATLQDAMGRAEHLFATVFSSRRWITSEDDTYIFQESNNATHDKWVIRAYIEKVK